MWYRATWQLWWAGWRAARRARRRRRRGWAARSCWWRRATSWCSACGCAWGPPSRCTAPSGTCVTPIRDRAPSLEWCSYSHECSAPLVTSPNTGILIPWTSSEDLLYSCVKCCAVDILLFYKLKCFFELVSITSDNLQVSELFKLHVVKRNHIASFKELSLSVALHLQNHLWLHECKNGLYFSWFIDRI